MPRASLIVSAPPTPPALFTRFASTRAPSATRRSPSTIPIVTVPARLELPLGLVAPAARGEERHEGEEEALAHAGESTDR